MSIITDFEFKVSKQQVIRTVQSYSSMFNEEQIIQTYDSLLPVLECSVNPAGMFKLLPKDPEFDADVLKNYEYIAHCAITIGNDNIDDINAFMAEGAYLEAIILDAMSTSLLFNLSSQLFAKVNQEARSMGMGMSCRIAPGDGLLEMEYQKHILNKLKDENQCGITINQDMALFPLKSMCYLYGASKSVEFNHKDHDCSKCNNVDCNMRFSN